MAQPKFIEKTLRMSQEVTQIFNDLDEYRDYCRFNFLKFNERDLYRSEQYRKFEKSRRWLERNKKAQEQ